MSKLINMRFNGELMMPLWLGPDCFDGKAVELRGVAHNDKTILPFKPDVMVSSEGDLIDVGDSLCMPEPFELCVKSDVRDDLKEKFDALLLDWQSKFSDSVFFYEGEPIEMPPNKKESCWQRFCLFRILGKR